MRLSSKIGMVAACVMLIGVFLPIGTGTIYISYIFVNPYPSLIILSAAISFVAAKTARHRLLWASGIFA